MNQITFIEYLKIIIPTALSLIAAIFSILTYRRNRRVENENYIYKTKQENYSKILFELGSLIDLLQKYINNSKNLSEERADLKDDVYKEEEDDLYELFDKIDDGIANFENIAIANSLVVPKSILEKIDSLNDILHDLEIPEPSDKGFDKGLSELDNQMNIIIARANELNQIIRNDLNVDELNFYLYKRLKK